MHYQAKKQLPLDERIIRAGATQRGRSLINAACAIIMAALVLAVILTPDSGVSSSPVVATLGNGAM